MGKTICHRDPLLDSEQLRKGKLRLGVGLYTGYTCQDQMGHRKTTNFQHMFPEEGSTFVTFHPYIEYDAKEAAFLSQYRGWFI